MDDGWFKQPHLSLIELWGWVRVHTLINTIHLDNYANANAKAKYSPCNFAIVNIDALKVIEVIKADKTEQGRKAADVDPCPR